MTHKLFSLCPFPTFIIAIMLYLSCIAEMLFRTKLNQKPCQFFVAASVVVFGGLGGKHHGPAWLYSPISLPLTFDVLADYSLLYHSSIHSSTNLLFRINLHQLKLKRLKVQLWAQSDPLCVLRLFVNISYLKQE